MTDNNRRTRLTAPLRRAQIVETATALLSRDGYYRFSLTELAKACDLTRPGVTHHIGSKEQLLLEVLEERDDRGFAAMRRALSDTPDSVRAALDLQVRLNLEQPELVRLYTILASEAMDSGHPAHEYFQRRWTDGVAELSGLLTAAYPDGHERAVQIYAFLDGLQLNWLRDPSIDLWGHWTHFADTILAAPHPSDR